MASFKKKWRGRVYVRPVDRGIVFEDGPHKDKYLSDLIEEITGNCVYGKLSAHVKWEPEAK